MAIGAGNTILAADYNAIQSTVANILGTGSGDRGYGQAVASSQVAAGATITASHMQNLKTDLDKISYHQANAASSAPSVSSGGVIYASDWSTYSSQSSTLDTNRLNLSAAQASLVDGVAPTFTNWNGTRTHVVTATFSSSEQARFFFNAGGQIRILPSQSGQSSSTTKGGRWNSLFTNIGGNGVVINLSTWNSLTGSASQIAQYVDSGTYSGNDLTITASKTSTVITMNISFNDDGTFGNIDENVDGTTTSAVKSYTASGSYVSVSAPSIATTSGP
jgi:hypothetical protein